VPDEIRERIFDMRGESDTESGGKRVHFANGAASDRHIYLTDIVEVDISATNIRTKIRDGNENWRDDVPVEVAKYIEKYQIYS